MKISNNHKSIITNTVLTACFLTAIFCAAAIQTQTITDILKNDQIKQQHDLNLKKLNNINSAPINQNRQNAAPTSKTPNHNENSLNEETKNHKPIDTNTHSQNYWIFLFINSFAFKNQSQNYKDKTFSLQTKTTIPPVNTENTEFPAHTGNFIANKLKLFQKNSEKSTFEQTENQTKDLKDLRLQTPIVGLGIKG